MNKKFLLLVFFVGASALHAMDERLLKWYAPSLQILEDGGARLAWLEREEASMTFLEESLRSQDAIRRGLRLLKYAEENTLLWGRILHAMHAHDHDELTVLEAQCLPAEVVDRGPRENELLLKARKSFEVVKADVGQAEKMKFDVRRRMDLMNRAGVVTKLAVQVARAKTQEELDGLELQVREYEAVAGEEAAVVKKRKKKEYTRCHPMALRKKQ